MNTQFCIEALRPETGAWVRLDYPPFDTALSASLFALSVLGHVDVKWRWTAIAEAEPQLRRALPVAA